MYTLNLHIAILYDTTLVKVVGTLREKTVNTPSVCNKNRAYCIQCTGARHAGALNTVGALAVQVSKCEVID